MKSKKLLAIMVTILGFGHAISSSAEASECKAKCVLLQRGAEAQFQIEMMLRTYRSDTILLADLGESSAESISMLESKCRLSGEAFLKSTPRIYTNDSISPIIVTDFVIDKSDSLQVVTSFNPFKICD